MHGWNKIWMNGWMDRFSHFTKMLTNINIGGLFDGLLKFYFYSELMDK